MKIIILGAGQVGANLAASLVAENNDITVIDLDASRLALLRDRFDLRTVRGHAKRRNQSGGVPHPSTLFNVPTRIARIRSNDLLGLEAGFLAENFGVRRRWLRTALTAESFSHRMPAQVGLELFPPDLTHLSAPWRRILPGLPGFIWAPARKGCIA